MKITEDIGFKKALIKQIAERELSERTGVHVSDLIYCLNKQALRRLQPLEPDEHTVLLYSLGWATQRWLTGQDKDEDTREVDGIQVTCDALSPFEETSTVKKDNKFLMLKKGDTFYYYGLVPWELKATYQSSNKPIEENQAWVRQVMAQCYVTKTTVAFLTRLELIGNWKSIFATKQEAEAREVSVKEFKTLPENEKPTLHAFRFEFTQQELDDNWEWLKARRDLFRSLLGYKSGTEVHLFKPLPEKLALPDGQEWECGFCPYCKQCKEAQ